MGINLCKHSVDVPVAFREYLSSIPQVFRQCSVNIQMGISIGASL